ncbi:MAG: hypothetical protein ACP5PX_08355, partial [Candidatus Hadarchaeum sp.]
MVRSNSSGLVTRGSGTDRSPTWMVGIGVGVAVGVAVGVLVGVAVAVGNGVALGATATCCVGVGADTGAQADKTKLTSKSAIIVRFIVRLLLRRSLPPNGLPLSRAAEGGVGCSGGLL